MNFFPTFYPQAQDNNYSLLLNGVFTRKGDWIFQNTNDLSSCILCPKSALRQIVWEKGQSISRGKPIAYSKGEKEAFSASNPDLIPSAVIMDALEVNQARCLSGTSSELLCSFGGKIYFPSGSNGSRLQRIPSNSNDFFGGIEVHNAINQVVSCSGSAIAIRSFSHVHIVAPSAEDASLVEFRESLRFTANEPSNIAFSHSELLVSHQNGECSFIDLNAGQSGQSLTVQNCFPFEHSRAFESFVATWGTSKHSILTCTDCKSIDLLDRRFKRGASLSFNHRQREHFPISQFSFIDNYAIFCQTSELGIFFDLRMASLPVLIDTSAGGSFFHNEFNSGRIFIYNEAQHKLKCHFYSCTSQKESGCSIVCPPMLLQSAYPTRREISLVSVLLKDDCIYQLYDNGSVFAQELEFTAYSPEYEAQAATNARIQYLKEPEYKFALEPFNQYKPHDQIYLESMSFLFSEEAEYFVQRNKEKSPMSPIAIPEFVPTQQITDPQSPIHALLPEWSTKPKTTEDDWELSQTLFEPIEIPIAATSTSSQIPTIRSSQSLPTPTPTAATKRITTRFSSQSASQSTQSKKRAGFK